MLEKFGLPTHIFGEILPPGSVLGTLREAIADEIGCPQVPVIAPATHDTGSAVAAVPASDGDYIYLSSGTWSLMGVESHHPIITEESLAFDFTNEGGVNDTFRVLKNIMGLWLVQECRREWSRQGHEYTYDDLTRLAAAAPAFGPIVAPSQAVFLPPGAMSIRIQAFCAQTDQPAPQSHGEVIRCALESLALEYRCVAERLDRLTGHRIGTIHIIGGGSRNRLLNQFTADATGRTVIAGPVEATAIGNLLVQAIALGHLNSLAEARAVVRRSFEVSVYEPGDAAPWEEAYQRYYQFKSAGKA
jgi:rhamnulokinase